MKRFALLLATLLASAVVLAQTPQTCKDAAGNQYSFLAAPVVVPPPPPPPPPPVVPPPPPAAGIFWVYHNGVFNWAGDYSFEASINYADTAGVPMDGPFDIAVTVTSRWGAWQPFAFGATGSPFDTSKYKYLVYSVKPTVAGQVIATGFDANNDIADGNSVVVAGPGLTKYGPVPMPGVWASYKIPLSDFNFTNRLVLKFTMADGSGSAARFYVDDVGFSP